MAQGNLKVTDAKWNFYPADCKFDGSSKDLKNSIVKKFDEKCKGNKSC